MNAELIAALKQIERERAIPLVHLLEAIESALVSAYKRHSGANQNVIIKINKDTGSMRIAVQKTVAPVVEDPQTEIALAEARKIDQAAKKGDVIELEGSAGEFGRIAAQTAKQVIVQRIREVERDLIYGEYIGRAGNIVSGIAQRYEQRSLLVDLGRVEAVLPQSEQVPHEHFRHGDRLKAYLLEVKKTTRGPQVVLSRSHPNLIKELFQLEVPEIHSGVIEVKSIVREPGYRSKFAVRSRDANIDPVGACVGPKGSRVQNVVDELRGEKIDIIAWSDDPVSYVAHSLSPAKVVSVALRDEDRSALVIVPDNMLSLAIGREGQNARLAARLTGWKIDIKSESQYREYQAALAGVPPGGAPPPSDSTEAGPAEPPADGELQELAEELNLPPETVKDLEQLEEALEEIDDQEAKETPA